MYRSKEQAKKKIKGKIRGIDYSKSKEGLPEGTRRLINNTNNVGKKIDHNILTKYNEDNIWNNNKTFSLSWEKSPPKHNEIFTKDGKLRWKLKTVSEMQIELNELRKKTLELRLRQKAYRMKIALSKKFFG